MMPLRCWHDFLKLGYDNACSLIDSFCTCRSHFISNICWIFHFSVSGLFSEAMRADLSQAKGSLDVWVNCHLAGHPPSLREESSVAKCSHFLSFKGIILRDIVQISQRVLSGSKPRWPQRKLAQQHTLFLFSLISNFTSFFGGSI